MSYYCPNIPLFREGTDTRILMLAIDKRWTHPTKAIIREVESNLAFGPIWFNVRPNFYININVS